MPSKRSTLRFGVALDYLDERLTLPENLGVLRELVQEAERAGFHVVYQGAHFLESRLPRFQPLPVLSSFAAQCGEMLIAWADLLPLNHPVRVAEELATMDVITGGRAVLVGVLGYQRAEFRAFGVDRSERGERLRTAYEVIAQLLAGERVAADRTYLHLEGERLGGMLEATAKPRPPIWVTAHNQAGVKRAALYGDVWFMSHQPRLSELREQLPTWREWRASRPALSYGEFDDHGIRFPVLRETMVAPETREALALAAEPMMENVGDYRRSDQLGELNDAQSYQLPFAQWRVDRALIGDPDVVTEELRRYVEVGIDCVVMKIHRKGIPFDRVLEAVKLIGEHVIPKFDPGPGRARLEAQ